MSSHCLAVFQGLQTPQRHGTRTVYETRKSCHVKTFRLPAEARSKKPVHDAMSRFPAKEDTIILVYRPCMPNPGLSACPPSVRCLYNQGLRSAPYETVLVTLFSPQYGHPLQGACNPSCQGTIIAPCTGYESGTLHKVRLLQPAQGTRAAPCTGNQRYTL